MDVTEKDNIITEDVENDEFMSRMIEALNRVPQEELPEEFRTRLSETLKEESGNIVAFRAAQRRKQLLRAVGTVAAVFVVGFISISMYNNGEGNWLDQLRGTEEETNAPGYTVLSQENQAAGLDEQKLFSNPETGGEPEEINEDSVSSKTPESVNDADRKTAGGTTYSTAGAKQASRAPVQEGVKDPEKETYGASDPDVSAEAMDSIDVQNDAPVYLALPGQKGPGDEGGAGGGSVCTTQSRGASAHTYDKEYYLKLIRETMGKTSYDILSCKKDSVSGDYTFKVQKDNEIITFLGSHGRCIKIFTSTIEEETTETGE